MSSKITAHRNGQVREFTPKQWEVMGTGHCGWSEVPEVPKEVVHTMKEVPPPVEIVISKNEILPPAKSHKKSRK